MKGRYPGVTMTYTSLLPGASSLALLSALSPEAKRRLKWMDHYRKTGNAAQTARYFGISRKTFYAWKKRYNSRYLPSLEERSRRPKRTRQGEISRSPGVPHPCPAQEAHPLRQDEAQGALRRRTRYPRFLMEDSAGDREARVVLSPRRNREDEEETEDKPTQKAHY